MCSLFHCLMNCLVIIWEVVVFLIFLRSMVMRGYVHSSQLNASSLMAKHLIENKTNPSCEQSSCQHVTACALLSAQKMFCLQTSFCSKSALIISSSCFVRFSPLEIFRGHLQNIWMLRSYVFLTLKIYGERRWKTGSRWEKPNVTNNLFHNGQQNHMLYIWLLLSVGIGTIGIHSHVNKS